MVRITIKDTDNTKTLLNALKAIDKKQIKVGLFGSDSSELVMIGSVHEYGADIPVTPRMRAWFAYNGYPLKASTTTITIPERSWLRTGYDENIDNIAKKVEQMLPAVLENAVDPLAFMDAIGLEFAGMIQKKMRAIRSPANSAMTVERKGSSNPLIDSGRLVGAIRHELE